MRVALLVLVGCGRIGFDPGTTRVETDAVTTFPGQHADPSLLPAASGQVEDPLPPGAPLSANESYLANGLRIWKLTDAAFPASNVSARVEREIAGAQVSAAFDDTHTVCVITDDPMGGRRRYLIDLQRGVGIAQMRELVQQGSEDGTAFTTDPVNPRVLFATDSAARLHRIDTTTNTVADTPPFPVDQAYLFPSVSAGGRVVTLQFRDPVVFDPLGYLAIDTATGTVDRLETGSTASPVTDHGGAFMTQATSGAALLWQIGALTTTTWKPPTGDFAPSVGVTGGFVSIDIDTGGDMPFYVSDPVTRTSSRFGSFGGYDTVELASQWIQTDVPVDQQWVLYTTFEQGFTGGPLDDAIGYLRLDGDLRFLAHHYGPDNPTFYTLPRASTSPDGRIVVFTSTMGTNRTDVYAIEVPLSQ